MRLMKIVDVSISILVEDFHRVVVLFCSDVDTRRDVRGVIDSILIKLAVPNRGGARVFIGRVENWTQEHPGGQRRSSENTSVRTLWQSCWKVGILLAWHECKRRKTQSSYGYPLRFSDWMLLAFQFSRASSNQSETLYRSLRSYVISMSFFGQIPDVSSLLSKRSDCSSRAPRQPQGKKIAWRARRASAQETKTVLEWANIKHVRRV